MEGRLETELSTVAILETPSDGKRKHKEESHVSVSPMELAQEECLGGAAGNNLIPSLLLQA